MDSAIQQMNRNPLDKYQQNLLSDGVKNYGRLVKWCKIQEIRSHLSGPDHLDSLIYIDSHSQALFPFTKITVQVQD